MRQTRPSLTDLLDRLEDFYGPQEPRFPVDPYEFLVWWYCGYLQTQAEVRGVSSQRKLRVFRGEVKANCS